MAMTSRTCDRNRASIKDNVVDGLRDQLPLRHPLIP
jgi:hypothetical protein